MKRDYGTTKKRGETWSFVDHEALRLQRPLYDRLASCAPAPGTWYCLGRTGPSLLG
jgi:hypothetical protein